MSNATMSERDKMILAEGCVRDGRIPVCDNWECLNRIGIRTENRDFISLGEMKWDQIVDLMNNMAELTDRDGQFYGTIYGVGNLETLPVIITNTHVLSREDFTQEYALAKDHVEELKQQMANECVRDGKEPFVCYHDELYAIINRDSVSEDRWEELAANGVIVEDSVRVSIYDLEGDELSYAELMTQDWEPLGKVADIQRGPSGIIEKIATDEVVISEYDFTAEYQDMQIATHTIGDGREI